MNCVLYSWCLKLYYLVSFRRRDCYSVQYSFPFSEWFRWLLESHWWISFGNHSCFTGALLIILSLQPLPFIPYSCKVRAPACPQATVVSTFLSSCFQLPTMSAWCQSVTAGDTLHFGNQAQCFSPADTVLLIEENIK